VSTPADPSSARASKLIIAIAVGALTTAGAAAGAATLLTASPNPSVWLHAYQRANECRQAAADRDPNCSTAAAQAMLELRIAATIESKAKSLASQRDQGLAHAPGKVRAHPSSRSVAPPAALVGPVPTNPPDDSAGPDA
jgi:hypothetical protein